MKNRISFFILFSILLHLLFLFFFWMGKNWIAQKPAEPPAIWVELKTLKDLPIADIQKPAKEEVPEKANAESLYDQKVEKETVSAGIQKQEREYSEQKKNPDLASKIPGMPEISSPPSAPSTPFSSDDFLPDYKIGNRTYINALANPNVGYFVELKRKYRLTWNPTPSLRGRANEIARGKVDVVLGVSVNGRGELVDLVVLRSSGLAGYDAEGKRTIRDSSPYSSPPSQLLKEDGLLHMAWTFVVYL